MSEHRNPLSFSVIKIVIYDPTVRGDDRDSLSGLPSVANGSPRPGLHLFLVARWRGNQVIASLSVCAT